ncbi:MAG: hypothetical protein KJ826_08100 [Proteobacteria bacterium]|nr:hypothetical protein [Pseudomonadota bacterium]
MLSIKEIRNNQDLLDNIDWEMTPEEAVRLFLEWGNNWSRGNYVIRGKEDVSYYFVVNTWGENPVVYLIRRNSDEAKELAEIKLPENVKDRFLDSIGNNKGVYSIEGDVKEWLQKELLGS